jgi:predicted nucleic acid-binding protein
LKSILLDSDVLIEVLRQRDAAILARWEQLVAGEALIVYSPVTVAEIWHGARPNERETVSRLFAALTCVPVDTEIGRKAGEYLNLYSRSHNLTLGDALIAATAAVHQALLWTRNRRHYPMKDIQLM